MLRPFHSGINPERTSTPISRTERRAAELALSPAAPIARSGAGAASPERVQNARRPGVREERGQE
jgi:hypothetical protein